MKNVNVRVVGFSTGGKRRMLMSLDDWGAKGLDGRVKSIEKRVLNKKKGEPNNPFFPGKDKWP